MWGWGLATCHTPHTWAGAPRASPGSSHLCPLAQRQAQLAHLLNQYCALNGPSHQHRPGALNVNYIYLDLKNFITRVNYGWSHKKVSEQKGCLAGATFPKTDWKGKEGIKAPGSEGGRPSAAQPWALDLVLSPHPRERHNPPPHSHATLATIPWPVLALRLHVRPFAERKAS